MERKRTHIKKPNKKKKHTHAPHGARTQTAGHTHMLKLSPETAREQKSNGDVREKEGGNKDVRTGGERRESRRSFLFI